MGPDSTLYFIILAVIASVSLLISIMALRKCDVAGSRPFAALMMSVALWSFAYATEFQFTSSATVLISTKIAFIAIVLVPVFWLLFALEYTGRDTILSDGRFYLLFIIPALTLIIIFTNESHHLFYSVFHDTELNGVSYLIMEYGFWYIVHTVYSYTLLAFGFLLFLNMYLDSPDYYRSQISIVLFGVLIPWAGNFVYLAGMFPNLMFDITPFFFLLTGIMIYVAVFSSSDFGIMPVARKTIVEVMPDGVFVLDKNNIIVDANPAAKKYAGGVDITGKNISAFFSGIDDCFKYYCRMAEDGGTPDSGTLEIQTDDKLVYYDIIISPLFPDDKYGGRLLIMRDVTGHKMAEKEVYLSKERYKNLYNNISDGIIVHNFAENGVLGRIIDANDIAVKMLGFSSDELFRMDGEEIQDAIVCEHDKSRYNRLKESGSLKYETSFVRQNNEVFPVFISSRIFYLDSEEMVISVIKDISVEKEARVLERQSLLQIEQNIEQLSTLNDHIRNPLAVIVGLCSLNGGKDSEKIIVESEKINEIVKKLDRSCLESEKIRQFLLKHYQFTIYSGDE